MPDHVHMLLGSRSQFGILSCKIVQGYTSRILRQNFPVSKRKCDALDKQLLLYLGGGAPLEAVNSISKTRKHETDKMG